MTESLKGREIEVDLKKEGEMHWNRQAIGLHEEKKKSALKGTRFESVDTVKAKGTELMNKLSEDNLQHCFQQWKIRMERCRDRGGEYMKGDISIV